MSETPFKINYPFDKVVELLPQMSEVDGVSAGVSPITFRWLTKGNVYVNIGLTEIQEYESEEDRYSDKAPAEEYCEIATNVNSFGVSKDAMAEIHAGIENFILKWDEDQKKKAAEDKAKEEAGIADIQARSKANAEAKEKEASE